MAIELEGTTKDKNSNDRWLMTGQRLNSLTLGDDVGSMSNVKPCLSSHLPIPLALLSAPL
jgi:hypothetical protein